ncbi:unnamed protein product [Darwinula stevensoni]|uniref:Peptidase S1 domain-containing protein n=1 Tax=Darwinula stevensoni TaxID=69355 RepID=A0A7R9A7P2_9CRUS|nr:unnamed protein product [Darwinula stevensoni]CAG0892846.1 unnamed protein product [Darwinula stevensoni]
MICGQSQTSAGKRSDDIPIEARQLDFDRIIGGTPVPSQRKYPWVGWMGTAKNNFICTSALINDRYMLTAAHCVQSNLAGTFYVTLGSTNLFQWPAGQSIQIAAKAIMHPNYNSQTLQNDIALLKLQTPLNFAAYPNIRPICLASANPIANSVVTIAGWGRTSGTSNALPKTLMETTVNVLSLPTCQGIWGSTINNNYVCVRATGKNICNGDSGGSLMYKTSRGYYQSAGVASFVAGSQCLPQYGGVFTSTASFRTSFILPNTRDAQWCATP